jgi:hypothetical protein
MSGVADGGLYMTGTEPREKQDLVTFVTVALVLTAYPLVDNNCQSTVS